jgi:hypothetical protein
LKQAKKCEKIPDIRHFKESDPIENAAAVSRGQAGASELEIARLDGVMSRAADHDSRIRQTFIR